MFRCLDHIYKHGRTPLDEWSACSSRRYLHNTQQTQQTNIHVLSEIRTPGPSNRASAEPRRRPRGHRQRYTSSYLLQTLATLVKNGVLFAADTCYTCYKWSPICCRHLLHLLQMESYLLQTIATLVTNGVLFAADTCYTCYKWSPICCRHLLHLLQMESHSRTLFSRMGCWGRRLGLRGGR